MYNSGGMYSGLKTNYNIIKPKFSQNFTNYLSNNLGSLVKNKSISSNPMYSNDNVSFVDDSYQSYSQNLVSISSSNLIYNPNPSLSYNIPINLASNYNLSKPNYSNTFFASSHSYEPVIGFLNPLRKRTTFINNNDEILPIINDIFNKIFDHDLPSDIVITVASKSKLKKIYETNSVSKKWNNGILGFARRNGGLKFVYVLESNLDSMLAVIGHEIGHVLSGFLSDSVDEEAKAFAFEFTFIKTIIDYNICNLASSFRFDYSPAKNGIHDIAFNFIKKLIDLGEDSLNIFYGLSEQKLSINDTIFSYAL